MIKTLKNLLKQDKERYTVPRKVQDVIPYPPHLEGRHFSGGQPLFQDLSVFATSTTLWQAVRTRSRCSLPTRSC